MQESSVIKPWDCKCDQHCCQKYEDGFIGVVINTCYGGFSYSQEASAILDGDGTGDGDEQEYDRDHNRHDWKLVKAICLLGPKANGISAKLRVKWIEAKYQKYYRINEYDGSESLEIKRSEAIVDEIKELVGESDDKKLLDKIKDLIAESSFVTI
jgi:hypothetical protein